jgi:CAMSAP CH domain
VELIVCLFSALSSSADVIDSLHNLRLVEQFCQRLSMPILHLSSVDLFYCVDEMLPNIAVFIADLFHCLESLGFDNFQPISSQVVPSNATVVTGIYNTGDSKS